ncbi:MAG: aminopeptidase P family protein [Polyangiales bacterium]
MLDPILNTCCAARRARLSGLIGAIPALIPAGSARPRNYLANTFPFRASSHFLYLVGLPLEGAGLWLDAGRAVLLLRPDDPDDALWHGARPSSAEVGAQLGLEVARWDDLPMLRGGRDVATLPPFDWNERHTLAGVVARDAASLGEAAHDAPLRDALIALRLVQDAGALGELRRAAAVTVDAHRAGMRATRAGVREHVVCAAMEQVVGGAGCTTAYPSIVSVHGEVLHNHHHGNLLEEGQLMLADVGAESALGYASDVTRTWPVSGTFSGSQRAIYELVLAMQHAAIEKVAPGVRYRDVHLAAARTLVDGLVQLGVLAGEVDALVEDGVHALFFPHGVGHLLGLDVHDMEDLGDHAGYAPGRVRSTQFGLAYLRLDRDLAPGMLVTIEPGFYQVPSLLGDPARVGLSARALDRSKLAAYADVRGIRIEDDVLVTDTGNEVLTRALAKEPGEVEALVGSVH